jgi:hypothetical protein
MYEPTYESIKHLISSEQQEKGSMQCVFKCPETGATAEATATISQSREIKNVAQAAVKRSLFSSLRRAVTSTLYSTLGGGMAGRAASQVSQEVMTNTRQNTMHSTADKHAAVVRAFSRVASKFRFDEDQGRWMGIPAGAVVETGFSQQLDQHPISGRYEQGILARMLVEIACADGTVSDDEREFLGDFIDPELGTIDDLATRDKLNAVDLEEAAEGAVRESMMMIAWTAALSDEGLADSEKARLSELAEALGMADDRAAEVRNLATSHLLEQAFAAAYPGGKRDDGAHAETMAYAAGLEVETEDVQRADIRYRKRMGIV